jgi:hypothetical protein
LLLICSTWNQPASNCRNIRSKSIRCVKFLKRFNQRESCENERRSGRPRKSDDLGDRNILRCLKTDRRESLTEITNKVNNVLPNTISTRSVRRRLRFHGFTRRKIRKTIRTENRHRRVHWCRSKVRWNLNRLENGYT